jgi:hypothetical protein
VSSAKARRSTREQVVEAVVEQYFPPDVIANLRNTRRHDQKEDEGEYVEAPPVVTRLRG